MANKNEMANDTSGREIITQRLLNAPQELVFEAFTQPEHIAKWWGPNGFTLTTSEMNVKPGGVWRFIMHGPDGRNYPNKIIYLKVEKPARLVYKHAGDGDGNITGASFDVEVTFEAQGNKTNLTMQMVFESVAERDRVVQEYGALEGAIQTINRLEEELAKMQTAKELVITRVFDAPRELVFKMWTEAKHLANWWGPKGFEPIVKKLEFKPGGEFQYGMKDTNGHEIWGKFIYRDIVELEKIVYVNCFCDEDGNTIRSPFMPNWPLEILNTVTFEFEGGKTKLTIAARPINAPEEEMEAFRTNMAGMQQGFGSIFEKLEEYLATIKQ